MTDEELVQALLEDGEILEDMAKRYFDIEKAPE